MNEPAVPSRRLGWRRLAQTLLAVALVAALLAITDVGALTDALRRADLAASGLGLACFAALVAIDAIRLRVAFSRYALPYSTCLGIQAGGYFLSNFTPGMAGAEVLKVVVAHRAERGLSRAVTLTLLLRLVGLVATVAMVVLYALLLPGRIAGVFAQLRPQEGLSGGLLLPGALGVAAAGLVAALLWRLYAVRLRAALGSSLDALREVGSGGAARLAALSFAMLAFGALSLWFLGRAVGVEIGVADSVVVLALLNFGSLLPFTPGGVGLREGAIAGGLMLFGAPLPDAVAAALLHRACFWIVSLAGGLWLARWRRGEGRDGPEG